MALELSLGAWLGIFSIGVPIAQKLFASNSTHSSSSAADPTGQNLRLRNSKSTQAMVPIIYGTARVSMNLVYITTNGTHNNDLHLVGVIGEGEIDGIYTVKGVPQIFLDDKIYTEYGKTFYHEFFNGSPTQNVCQTLASACPDWDDPLKRTAYLYMRLTYDAQRYQGLPNFTMIVNGLKVFDPRSNATAFTANPALCAYDFATRSSCRGGMGFLAERVNINSVKDAANYCDKEGWAIGLPLYESRAASDMLADILATFRGELLNNDRLQIRYKDLKCEAPVIELNANNIIADSVQVTTKSIYERPNAVNMKFYNSAKNYQDDNFIFADNSLCTIDTDYREQAINLYGVNRLANVQKLANYHLETLRNTRVISLQAGGAAAGLELYDIVAVNFPRYTWVNKLMRVEGITQSVNGVVGLSLLEENGEYYDDVYNLSEVQKYSVALVTPQTPVPSVRNVVLMEEVYYYRLRSFTRLHVTFDAPPANVYPFWQVAEIWVRINRSGEWKFQTFANASFILNDVQEGVNYQIKIVGVSSFGTKENFDSSCTVGKTILGMATVPPDISWVSGVVSSDNISIRANDIGMPDCVGYEVRLGTTWNEGMLVGFNSVPIILLIGVKPGTYPFWVAAKNNAGLYSNNPQNLLLTVQYPIGYVTDSQWSYDYTTGAFDNAQRTLYNSIYCLASPHINNTLVGEWTSPVHDLGSIKTVKIWGDFTTDFNAPYLEWDVIAPSPMTWAQLNVNRTWAEIFKISQAAKLQSSLFYSGDNVNFTEIKNFEMSAPEIAARYFYIVVTINDPQPGCYIYLRPLNITAAHR